MNLVLLWITAPLVLGQNLVQNQHGVFILTNEVFDTAIRMNQHILVDFYAPWCKPCIQFEPDYYQISRILLSNPKNTIRLASYDATKDRENGASRRYKIASYPALLFFINGIPFTYEGSRKIDSIISWMRLIVYAPQPIEMKSVDDINQFIAENELPVFYFGSGSIFKDQNFWTYYQVTKTATEGQYAYTLNEYLINKTGNSPNTLIAYKNFDETKPIKKKFSQAFTRENVQRFVLQSSLPDVPPIDEKAERLIFESNVPAFLLFVNYEEPSILAEQAFLEVAKIFQGGYQFAVSRITDELFFRTLDRLGADDRHFPQLFAVTPPQLKKYLFEQNNFTVAGIKNFIYDYRQNKLPKFIKSEAVEPQVGSVVRVVALTWEEQVVKEQRDLLIEVYTQWCKPCKEFKPQYDLLGYTLSNNNNVVVARIDHGENEVPLQMESYPAFFFFGGNDKYRKPIPFTGNRTLPQLQQFIKSQTSY